MTHPVLFAASVLVDRKDGRTEERWLASPYLRRSTPFLDKALFFPSATAAEAAALAANMRLVGVLPLGPLEATDHVDTAAVPGHVA